MGIKQSTEQTLFNPDEETIERIWREHDKDGNGYLLIEEMNGLLQSWCLEQKKFPFAVVKSEFWSKFPPKDGKVWKTDLLPRRSNSSSRLRHRRRNKFSLTSKSSSLHALRQDPSSKSKSSYSHRKTTTTPSYSKSSRTNSPSHSSRKLDVRSSLSVLSDGSNNSSKHNSISPKHRSRVSENLNSVSHTVMSQNSFAPYRGQISRRVSLPVPTRVKKTKRRIASCTFVREGDGSVVPGDGVLTFPRDLIREPLESDLTQESPESTKRDIIASTNEIQVQTKEPICVASPTDDESMNVTRTRRTFVPTPTDTPDILPSPLVKIEAVTPTESLEKPMITKIAITPPTPRCDIPPPPPQIFNPVTLSPKPLKTSRLSGALDLEYLRPLFPLAVPDAVLQAELEKLAARGYTMVSHIFPLTREELESSVRVGLARTLYAHLHSAPQKLRTSVSLSRIAHKNSHRQRSAPAELPSQGLRSAFIEPLRRHSVKP